MESYPLSRLYNKDFKYLQTTTMKITAEDVVIMSLWMQVQKLERELRENRDYSTKQELSEGGRRLKKDKYRSLLKRYRRALKKTGRMEEFEHYMELKAERQMEEDRMRAYDEREAELNEMWLESYDLID